MQSICRSAFREKVKCLCFLLKTSEHLQPRSAQAAAAVRIRAKSKVLHNAAVLIDGEKIAAVTANGELPEYSAYADIVDAHGALATPGLVDAHTHLVFGGWARA